MYMYMYGMYMYMYGICRTYQQTPHDIPPNVLITTDLDVLHDVKLRANHVGIVTKQQRPWDWELDLMESRNDPELSVHLHICT